LVCPAALINKASFKQDQEYTSNFEIHATLAIFLCEQNARARDLSWAFALMTSVIPAPRVV
jgi:hypothetical protein